MKPLRYIMLILMLAAPAVMHAQYSWDWAGVEAFISDHKAERSVLLARSVLEQSNAVLHSNSNDTNKKYKEMGEELDKYTKAFDAIDLVFNTLSTGFNIYHTVNDVSDKVSKYKDLLEDFNDKIIKRGKIERTDTLLYTINAAAISELYAECQNIYASVLAIGAYSSGQLLANTSCINLQIKRIDECLTRIQQIIDTAYFHTLTYIKSRIYMWNKRIFTEKSKLTIANEAFGRWRTHSQGVESKE